MFGYFVTGDEVPVSPEAGGASGGPGGGGGRNSVGSGGAARPPFGGGRNTGLAPPSRGVRNPSVAGSGGGGPPPPITNDSVFRPGGGGASNKRGASFNPSQSGSTLNPTETDTSESELSSLQSQSHFTKAQAKRKAQLLQHMQARVQNLASTQKAIAAQAQEKDSHLKKQIYHQNLHQKFLKFTGGGNIKKPERKFGYGDATVWNALSAVDQARIRGHSVKLLQSFRITKWFLRIMGRFPFDPKKLEDGSYTFTWSPCSFSYFLFLLSSLIAICIFIMFTIGFVFIFVVADPDKQLHDRCGNSWGTTILSRNMPAVVFVWSQMMLSAAGSVYVMIHGQSFLEFYNVVNEAVMQLDMDPSHGTFYSDIRGMIVFGCLFFACIIVAASGVLKSLDEVCVFVVQCLCFLFVKDIYVHGSSKVFTVWEYEVLRQKCGTDCLGCYGKFLGEEMRKKCSSNDCYNVINTPTFYAELARWVGFGIILYSFLGARALIRQFEFFCQVLVNLQSMWNKRFLNYSSRGKKRFKLIKWMKYLIGI